MANIWYLKAGPLGGDQSMKAGRDPHEGENALTLNKRGESGYPCLVPTLEGTLVPL